ncbi:Hypothetical predicted protein, partial [Pelobates cultripes]
QACRVDGLGGDGTTGFRFLFYFTFIKQAPCDRHRPRLYQRRLMHTTATHIRPQTAQATDPHPH